MSPSLIAQAKEFLLKPRQAGGIAVVGDLCVDRFVFGTVERISPEAPVPVLAIERTLDKPGCAANVAANLATLKKSWNFQLSLLGLVGQDAAGASLLTALAQSAPGIDTRVIQESGRPTTLKTRFIAGSQHQMLRVDDEVTAPFAPQHTDRLAQDVEALLPQLKCLVIQDYAKGLCTSSFLPRLLKSARAQGVLTLVDPNRHTPGERYSGAGLMTPNVIEAEALLGRPLHRGADDRVIAEACAELKRRFHLDMAIITRSGHGMTLVDKADRAHHFPALARAVFDVTGAGDTVAAFLAASIAAGASMELACILATAAASVVVGKVGTATASVDEVLAELDEFPKSA
ncbi:MAG: bifunctional hydroxymethylpyrimidine kinase/phosphomethylpyrimidine kinase [Bdellovibrionales bacterium]|nr:bifunctional hydroxymethylpyrimidine kinase/phosphomethylpyrimidine kinase [Bdellovibrionales bacterium]